MLSLSIFYKRKKFLSKEVFQFKIKDKKNRRQALYLKSFQIFLKQVRTSLFFLTEL